jgi:serine/threonine protein kinase
VSDFGVTETGVAFLVMELLEGKTLVEEIRRYGKVPPQRCLEILEPVCEVLAEAHAAGLVHRDIKPENIFLHRTPRGEEIKVLDFGIAKLVGETVAQENLTAEGWILGTPAYIAPERVNDQGYDGRSDVYSVGILLFEMLTGRRPFRTSRKDPMGLLMMHVNAEPPTLLSFAPELSTELEELVARTIRKQPDQRPDARELAEGLARAITPAASASTSVAVAGSPGGGIDPHASTVQLSLAEEPGGLKGWLRRITGPRS